MENYTNSCGIGRSQNHGRGRGNGGRSSNSRPTCQIYGKQGHIDVACWYRLHESYQGALPQVNQNQQQATKAEAFFAGPETVVDQAWYADSGATNHVAAELNQL